LHCSDAWFECQRARVAACGHAVLVRSDRSRGLRRSDGGYGSVRYRGTPRRDYGPSFDGRLRPVRSGSLGDRGCARLWGGPQSAGGWFLAFVVLAVGISLGPIALWWSRAAAPGRIPAE
jgi:hypothetical protein